MKYATLSSEIRELNQVLDEVDEFKRSLAFAYLHGMRDAEKCRESEKEELLAEA